MKVVKFKNGKFGIMKLRLIDRILKREGLFYDFKPVGDVRWVSSRDRFFNDCQVDSIKEAEIKLAELSRKAVKRVIDLDYNKSEK